MDGVGRSLRNHLDRCRSASERKNRSSILCSSCSSSRVSSPWSRRWRCRPSTTGAQAVEKTPAVVPAETTAAAAAIPAQVAEAAPEEKKQEKWYDRIDFKGDLRLRGEFFKVDGISDNDRRERFRVRIRPGIYTNVTDWMKIGLQVRSGDPKDPVSDNSSFDGGFSLIPISISEGIRPVRHRQIASISPWVSSIPRRSGS